MHLSSAKVLLDYARSAAEIYLQPASERPGARLAHYSESLEQVADEMLFETLHSAAAKGLRMPGPAQGASDTPPIAAASAVASVAAAAAAGQAAQASEAAQAEPTASSDAKAADDAHDAPLVPVIHGVIPVGELRLDKAPVETGPVQAGIANGAAHKDELEGEGCCASPRAKGWC
ncbi:unnamed protein product [Durusdinium trenchii]|uniref:Uncharacterized protein n=1 Tax=Durusdinium trenchii TaxID=1381693 RepID=A0ABP0KT19_9DINO